MSVSLIEHELIKTTLPKAKDLRAVIEPIITHAKKHMMQLVVEQHFRVCVIRKAVQSYFQKIAPRYKERPGGYVRILKCGYRVGDQAPMAYVEFVDRPAMAEES